MMDLNNISEVSTLDDNSGETISGGAFRYRTGEEVGVTQSRTLTVDIQRATELGIVNTDSNAGNPNAGGHNFTVRFLRADNSDTGIFNNVTYGDGIRAVSLDFARQFGATKARIIQGPQRD